MFRDSQPVRIVSTWGTALVFLIALACGPGGESEPAAPPQPAPPVEKAKPAPTPPVEKAEPAAAPEGEADPATADALAIFSTRCFTCHGPEGAGDGPGSAGLNPPPRNFQDPEWQASVTDEHLQKIVMFGGTSVGKSPIMPGNPDLMSKPDVVAALVVHIRSLASN